MANAPRKPTNNSPYKTGSSSQLGVGAGVPPGGGNAPKPGSMAGPQNPNLKTSKSLTGVDSKTNDSQLSPRSNFNNAPPKLTGDHPNAKPYDGPVMKVQGGSFVPQINMDSMPELDTDVTIEFALEQMSRVLIELAEHQEDPVWVQAHLTLAQEWHGAAATLLQHRVDMESTRGEVELKQQQMVHNDMDHQQKFVQQDQMHQQNIKHQDAMNKMNMQHQDGMNKMGMQNTQMQNKMGQQLGDQKNKMALQQQKETHQNKMQFTKQTQQLRVQKMRQSSTSNKKPAPKKG